MAPTDWKFEPCQIHHDTVSCRILMGYIDNIYFLLTQDALSIEPAPKIFLQNKLRRCREKLQELTPVTESKREFLEMHLTR